MKLKTISKTKYLHEDNPFSMSIGDLMAGLLLIFMLLLSSTMLRLEQEKERQLGPFERQKQTQKNLIDELMKKFKDRAEVDPQTGAIRIKDSVFFDSDKFTLEQRGKDFLRNFIPEYSDILLTDRFREHLAQIIIEGHTDNLQGYIYNLDLSLNRAASVAKYIFSDDFGDFPYKEEFRKLLSINGRSFMEPRVGNETASGRAQNRRVEFKFRLKDWDTLGSIGQGMEATEK